MPNHVSNEITASDEVLKALLNEEGEIDFNTVVPMPESLSIAEGSDTSLGKALVDISTSSFSQEDLDSRLKGKSEEEIEKLRELGITALQNIEKYGHQSWYGWCVEHWGTKWNAYGQEIKDDSLEFETAWSAPISVLEALSKKFPEERIRLRWADEDTSYNVGDVVFLNGKIVEDNSPIDGSKEAYELAFALSGSEEYYEFNEETDTYKYVDPYEEEELV